LRLHETDRTRHLDGVVQGRRRVDKNVGALLDVRLIGRPHGGDVRRATGMTATAWHRIGGIIDIVISRFVGRRLVGADPAVASARVRFAQ
jgi:hypothetical protein